MKQIDTDNCHILSTSSKERKDMGEEGNMMKKHEIRAIGCPSVTEVHWTSCCLDKPKGGISREFWEEAGEKHWKEHFSVFLKGNGTELHTECGKDKDKNKQDHDKSPVSFLECIASLSVNVALG